MAGAFRNVTRCFHGLYVRQLPIQKCMQTSINGYLFHPCMTSISRNKSTYVPTPPVPPQIVDSVPEISQALNALGEPTLSSLGLATWYPPGLIQYGLESLHVGLDMPWWAAIVVGTVILRTATFPITVLSQRRSAHFHNNSPQMNKLQAKVEKAKRSNNSLEVAKAAVNLQNFMKENDVRPLANMLLPMAQLPIFLSVFVGLRQMSNLPVESMANGGFMWFVDLTTSDPFFILPIATAATFLATIEVGIDTVRPTSASTKSKWFMRAMPIIMFPFTVNFPSSLLLYWFTSNGVSLLQALLLRAVRVRKMLKIPMLKYDAPDSPPEKTTFIQSVKNSWKNSKTTVNVEERMRAESVKFREAGMGAIPKTYTYDPTKK